MKKAFLILGFLSILGIGNGQTVGLIQHSAQSLEDGYVLFPPLGSNSTYLIDKCGREVKSWSSTYKPGQSAYLLEDGSLLRPGNTNNVNFNAGGKGGIIQIMDWNGNLTWSYLISDATHCQHHDVRALPNGNILVIAWEAKSNSEAIAAGRNPALVPATLWSEKILEIEPSGSTGGNIVWEWHVWDHLVQDFDTTKPNFGTVSGSPQLLDLNYGASATQSDWIHMNSVDYNAALDQIVVSSHGFDEIWIIDHSTSTSEAASHTGGNSGMGGDILYRWGNPRTYDQGTISDQKFFGQHNARWIESSYPFGDQLMIFNNGNGRPGGNYSTVEIINPPVNGYSYTNSLPYLPASTSWNYNAGNPNSLYAQNISGAQPLSNGNVLVCNGPAGNFLEVTNAGATVWKYINPVTMNGIIPQNTAPVQNQAFRCTFYPTAFQGFSGHVLTAGNTLENSNPQSDTCNLALEVEESAQNLFLAFPNPAQDRIYLRLESGGLRNGSVALYNSIGKRVFSVANGVIPQDFSIPTEGFENGVYVLQITSEQGSQTSRICIAR